LKTIILRQSIGCIIATLAQLSITGAGQRSNGSKTESEQSGERYRK